MAVTHRCNAHCALCGVRAMAGSDALRPEHMARLPRSLRRVNLTGGEPFLRTDLANLVRRLRVHCRRAVITISTNGLLGEGILSAMADILPVDPAVRLAVSIEGIGEPHDRARGQSGAFARAMRVVRLLHEKGYQGVRLRLMLGRHNVDQLLAVHELAVTMGVPLEIVAAPCGVGARGAYGSSVEPGHADDLLCEAFATLIAQWLRSWRPRQWRRAHAAYLVWRTLVGRNRPARCPAGREAFFLQADGTVFDCPAHGAVMGNLVEQTWDALWRSDAARQARRAARQSARACGASCQAGRAYRRRTVRMWGWVALNKLRAHAGRLRLSAAGRRRRRRIAGAVVHR